MSRTRRETESDPDKWKLLIRESMMTPKRAGLSSTEWLVMCVLGGMARTMVYCWPSNETIGKELNLKVRRIQQVLESLEGKVWIGRQHILSTTTKDSSRVRIRRVGIILYRRVDIGPVIQTQAQMDELNRQFQSLWIDDQGKTESSTQRKRKANPEPDVKPDPSGSLNGNHA